jgi:hypothetical protein
MHISFPLSPPSIPVMNPARILSMVGLVSNLWHEYSLSDKYEEWHSATELCELQNINVGAGYFSSNSCFFIHV